MARYKLEFKKSVSKDLRSLPKQDVRRILRRIDQLSDDPRGAGCKKLAGREYYRVRLGSYRILYEIFDNQLIIHVIKVGRRSAVYR